MARMVSTPDHAFISASEVTKKLTFALGEAAKGDVVITQHGKPVGVLRGFPDRADWLDYRLECDPKFQADVAAARARLRARGGKGGSGGGPKLR